MPHKWGILEPCMVKWHKVTYEVIPQHTKWFWMLPAGSNYSACSTTLSSSNFLSLPLPFPFQSPMGDHLQIWSPWWNFGRHGDQDNHFRRPCSCPAGQVSEKVNFAPYSDRVYYNSHSGTRRLSAAHLCHQTCLNSQHLLPLFQNFPGAACPRTPLDVQVPSALAPWTQVKKVHIQVCEPPNSKGWLRACIAISINMCQTNSILYVLARSVKWTK